MGEKIHKVNDDYFFFHCPACDRAHAFNSTWEFNNNLTKPTVSPSLLVTGGEHPACCHSFVTDGQIRFLEDCTHTLKGQTVELPDWK